MANLANLKMKNPEQIPDILRKYQQKKLRVGFSGGADSTALLLLLLKWHWQPEQLEAVHFDHGLRGAASRADALWCQQFCAERRIKFTLVELNIPERITSGESVEDFARRARLNYFSATDDNSPVVLAHHADDVVENMLLKLARGGNVSSASSLRNCRKLWNLTVLRPLLEWHKSELEAFLIQEGISDWRHDRSNDSCDYHRNYLRNQLLIKWHDYHPPVLDGLRQSAQMLALDADFIEQAAAGKITDLADADGQLPCVTKLSFWQDMHGALQGRVWRSYLAGITGQVDLQLTHGQLDYFRKILQMPEKTEKRCFQMSRNLSLSLKNGLLFVNPDQGAEKLPEPCLWDWRSEREVFFAGWYLTADLLSGSVAAPEYGTEQQKIYYFDVASMPEKLYLDLRRGGETMTVWGAQSPRRVKHLLSGAADKNNILILRDQNHTIYMLADLRRSNLAPVTGNTALTLQVSVKRCY